MHQHKEDHMIQRKSLDELVATVIRDAQDRRDFIVSTTDLRMGSLPGNKVALRGPSNERIAFDVTDHAHGQIAQAVGIPGGYYRHLQGRYPELLAENVNTLWVNEPQKRMVRTLRGVMRANMSDKYRRMDHDKILAPVLPVLKERGFEITSMEVTESKLWLQVVTPRIEGEVRKGDVVQAGFVLTNSEIGAGSLRFERMLYRLACTNGMILPDRVVKRHLGARQEVGQLDYEQFAEDTRRATDDALYLQLRDTIDSLTSPAAFQASLMALQDSAKDSVVERGVTPVDAFNAASSALELTSDEHTVALTEFLDAQDFTRWGLANAITWTANSHSSYERAVELEAVGGRLMTMPTRELYELVEVGR
jgi:hypothetical protein